MIDIQIIRDNPELVKQKSEQKGYSVDIDRLLQLDERRKELLKSVEDLRQKRNEIAAKMKGGKPEQSLIEEGKNIKQQLSGLEDEFNVVEAEWLELLKAVPNMPAEGVPVGYKEEENVVVKEVGQKPVFDFEPKTDFEIAESKGWLDKERGAKIAGSRFVYLKGDLVLLEFALWQYALNILTSEQKLKEIASNAGLDINTKPFLPVLPPAVARTEVFQATGRLNKEEQTYKIEDEDLWLNASAEHTMAPMYLNEILNADDLPIRLVGYTTAFRREAGTYGKDTEGWVRLHQFNKLEMESFSSAEQSLNEHLFMIAIQEYLMSQLGLPYRVLEKCTADIGRPNAKGVDIDVWLPAQGIYRETHTADYITDFQARAMKTRVRFPGGKVEFAHTNDATVFSQRPLIGIIENYQTANGDVRVPDVLKPYMSGKELI